MLHVANYRLNYQPNLGMLVIHLSRQMNLIQCNRFDCHWDLNISTFLSFVTRVMALQLIDCDVKIIPKVNVPSHQMRFLKWVTVNTVTKKTFTFFLYEKFMHFTTVWKRSWKSAFFQNYCEKCVNQSYCKKCVFSRKSYNVSNDRILFISPGISPIGLNDISIR